MKRRSLSFVIGAGAAAVCVAAPASVVGAEPVKATPAESFIDSIGVCAHWGYGDRVYGTRYAEVRKKLVESGIRHVRDGISRPVEIERIKELGKIGIRHCVVAEPDAGGTPEGFRDLVIAINKAVPGAVDAVEGPNEPDYFWHSGKKQYGGKNGGNSPEEAVAAAVLYHKDLFRAFRAKPETEKITVLGIALGKTYGPGTNPIPAGELTDFVDWGNFHPYMGGNPFSFPFPYAGIEKYIWHGTNPSQNMDEFPYAFETYQPPYGKKPMAATECGAATDTNGTSESAHGKYIPRMFLEYFRKGIKRAYSYELVDEGTNSGEREERFGLLRNDLTEKPAFVAVKNLIRVLADPQGKKPWTPGTLDYSVKVSPPSGYDRPQYVRSVLLQRKTDGAFYLALWHEISAEDGSTHPRRQLSHPPMPTTVSLNARVYPAVRIWEWNEDGTVKERQARFDGKSLDISVTDRITLVKIAPKPR